MDEITPEFLERCGFTPIGSIIWRKQHGDISVVVERAIAGQFACTNLQTPLPLTRSRLRSLWYGLTGERLDSRASEADDDAVLVACDKLEDDGWSHVADRVREMVAERRPVVRHGPIYMVARNRTRVSLWCQEHQLQEHRVHLLHQMSHFDGLPPTTRVEFIDDWWETRGINEIIDRLSERGVAVPVYVRPQLPPAYPQHG